MEEENRVITFAGNVMAEVIIKVMKTEIGNPLDPFSSCKSDSYYLSSFRNHNREIPKQLVVSKRDVKVQLSKL
jgi:hypothetical protein